MPRIKPTKEMDDGRIIRHAARVLADREWTQGRDGTLNTAVCTRGAVVQSSVSHLREVGGNATFSFSKIGYKEYLNQINRVYEALNAFAHWLVEQGQAKTPNIPGWNDAPGQTKENVLTWMNKFADEMDPQRP